MSNRKFVRGSATSEDAWDEIALSKDTLRRHVLDLLRRFVMGLTDEEMQDHLGMIGNTQRPRRVELMDAGLVCDSGRTRPTRSGRMAVVWCVTLKGALL